MNAFHLDFLAAVVPEQLPSEIFRLAGVCGHYFKKLTVTGFVQCEGTRNKIAVETKCQIPLRSSLELPVNT